MKAAFFLIGAAVGSSAALLMAPQAGKRTRRMLRRKAEDTAGYFADARSQARWKYRDLKKGVREVLHRAA
jgi:gas vesicle protein